MYSKIMERGMASGAYLDTDPLAWRVRIPRVPTDSLPAVRHAYLSPENTRRRTKVPDCLRHVELDLGT